MIGSYACLGFIMMVTGIFIESLVFISSGFLTMAIATVGDEIIKAIKESKNA